MAEEKKDKKPRASSASAPSGAKRSVGTPSDKKKTGTKKPAAKKPRARSEAASSAAKRSVGASSDKKTGAKKAVVKPKAASSTKQRSVQRHEARTKRPDGYFYAVGRRKAAIAQVKLWPEQKKLEVKVNGKELKDYFGARFELLDQVIAPLVATGLNESVKIEAKVSGGGLRGQAEAIRLGVARTLLLINPEYRLSIKKLGYLMRDPRVKERKKPGLKKARRAPQWSKR